MTDSGNALYLVCEACNKAGEGDFGFKLAERGIIGAYELFGPSKHSEQMAIWLKKHQLCAGKHQPDHFQLAHQHLKNHDQPEKPKRPILSIAK